MNKIAEKSVYFIIVNWKNTPDTLECLESLAKINYKNYKIILITYIEDRKEHELFNKFEKINIITIHENLGFAKSANLGIEEALSENADYILNLNNDTVVDPEFLNPLVDYCESNKQIMVSPAIFLYNTNCIDSYGGQFLWWLGIARLIKHKTNKSPDYLSGACYLCAGECFREIGLFNEDYFLYYEDSDWFKRAKSKGYNFHILYKSRIWHKSSASSRISKGWGPVKSYYMARNNLLFAKNNLSGYPKYLWILTYILIGSNLHLLFFCRSFEAFTSHFKGLLQGLKILKSKNN